MRKKITLIFSVLILMTACFFTGILTSGSFKNSLPNNFIKFDQIVSGDWGEDFKIIEIPSSIDENLQKNYTYQSTSKTPRPLIVSLHTWSGNYSQVDPLASLVKEKNINYIHPNFRGPNKTFDACVSNKALSDIDDAITYALKHFNVNPDEIYIVGFSGGGYATLSAFMKSKHNIKKFSAWASITDLNKWYNEGIVRENNYPEDIIKCTSSTDEKNLTEINSRSPINWQTPVDKLKDSKLSIYHGIYDGIDGSVPITHSINFYNKILSDIGVKDSTKYVTSAEKLKLLEFRKPLGDFKKIGDRDVFFTKKYRHINLVIFEGNHELLPEYALNNLLEQT